MGKPLTKSQIAEHLAEKSGLTKRAMVQLLDEFAALAYREAKNVFTVPGLGKLKLANRKARIGRNPQTGKELKNRGNDGPAIHGWCGIQSRGGREEGCEEKVIGMRVEYLEPVGVRASSFQSQLCL